MSQSLEQSILQEAKVGFVKSGWVPGCHGSTNQIRAENDGQGNVVSLGTGLSSDFSVNPFQHRSKVPFQRRSPRDLLTLPSGND